MTTQNPASDGPVPPTPPPGAGAPPPGAGTPPPDAAGAATPASGFFHAIRGTGLYRSDDRWIGGVAGGLAARFGLDPLLVRGAFLVTLLLGGFGLVVYALAWALLPEQRDGRIHIEGLTLGHPDIALLGALLMFIGGVGNGTWIRWPVHVPGWLQGLFWLGATVLVVVMVASLASSHRRPAPPYIGPLPTRDPRAAAPMAPGAAAPYAGPAAPAGAPMPHTTTPAGPTPATSSQGAPITMPVPPTAPPAPPYAGGPYQGQPYQGQPYRYSPPPAPPRPVPPPAPPKPPRRGPGATTVGITVALALFVVAGALIAQRAGWLDRSTAATAAALVVVIFGAAIIVSGLRGRTGGILGFFAVVALVAALPLTIAARSDIAGWPAWQYDSNGVHVDPGGTAIIGTRADAERGIQVGLGDATVDLTDVPLDDQVLTVPINLGAGDFTILVPEDVRASATVDIGAGQVTWRVAGDDASSSGLGIGQQTFGDTDDPQLELRVKVGAGNVTIEEGN